MFQYRATYGGHLPDAWGVRALLAVEHQGQSFLYAASETTGALLAFGVGSDGGLDQQDRLGASGGRGTYGVVGLDLVEVPDGMALLPAGRWDDRMAFHRIGGDGGFDSVRILGSDPLQIGAIEATLSLRIEDKTFLIAAQQGQDGFRSFRVRDDLSVEHKAQFTDAGSGLLGDISALAALQVGGRSYFFTASSTHDSVSSWWMGRWGNVKERDTIDASSGLWVSAPSSLVTAEVAGRGYVVLASAGSDSLTAMRMDAWGGLFVTDHLLDTRQTRFGGVSALAAFDVNDRSFIVAGGADDGLTLLELAPMGQLIVRASLADSVDSTLSNGAAIEAAVSGSTVDLYVTSAAEPGISHLQIDLGPLGDSLAGRNIDDTLHGTPLDDILVGSGGDDLIFGGDGNDILIDGADIDRLTGGAGADVFMFLSDGRMDTVTDFQPGLDRLDLSDYPLLHDMGRLHVTQRDYGVLIEYGRDRFRIEAEGRQLMVAELTPDDFIFA